MDTVLQCVDVSILVGTWVHYVSVCDTVCIIPLAFVSV